MFLVPVLLREVFKALYLLGDLIWNWENYILDRIGVFVCISFGVIEVSFFLESLCFYWEFWGTLAGGVCHLQAEDAMPVQQQVCYRAGARPRLRAAASVGSHPVFVNGCPASRRCRRHWCPFGVDAAGCGVCEVRGLRVSQRMTGMSTVEKVKQHFGFDLECPDSEVRLKSGLCGLGFLHGN